MSAETILKICSNPPKDIDFFEHLAEEVYALEQNGDPKHHAKQLAYFFGTPKSARVWLKFYVENTNHDQPLHELCRHIVRKTIPFPALEYFGEGNLKYLFCNLRELEFLMSQHEMIIRQNDLETLKSRSIKEMLRLHSKKLDEIALAQTGIVLDELSEPQKIHLEQIRKFNKRFKRPPYDCAKQILDLMEQSTDSDAFLPRITLKSEEIGLSPGHYFTKLTDNDIRSALIGHFLDCCQHIGGPGGPCAEHAITSKFGATYVIFAAKISEEGETIINPIHDNPIVGSWVWTDGTSGIGFDSIESSKVNATLREHEIAIFYHEYARRMLDKAPDYIQKIIVGSGGETPKTIGHKPLNIYHARKISPDVTEEVKYTGYSDSRVQRILTHRECQDYYGIHSLNLERVLKALHDTDHPDLKVRLALKYSEHFERYSLPTPQIPAWLKTLDFPYGEEPVPQPLNLGLWLDKENMSLAMKLIRTRAHLTRSESILKYLEKNLTAEICNSGSYEKSLFHAALEYRCCPISFIDAMFEAGVDPNIEDEDTRVFANLFAVHRTSIEFNPKWISEYGLDLNRRGSTGKLPLIRSFVVNTDVSMAETYLKYGADPHLQDGFGSTFLHMIAADPHWLLKAPSRWPALFNLNFEVKDKAGKTASSIAISTVGRSNWKFEDDTLGGYFLNIYDNELAALNNYEELVKFLRSIHDPFPDPKSPLKILGYLKSEKESHLTIIDRFLNQGLDYSKYIGPEETHFTALAKNCRDWFRTRWFKFFDLKTEEEMKLQFQIFVHQGRIEQIPEDYEASRQYAENLAKSLVDLSSCQAVFSWFEPKRDFDVKSSELLCLINLFHKYKVNYQPLLKIYLGIQGSVMPYNNSYNSHNKTGLDIAALPGVDEFCKENGIPTFSFVLLRDGAGQTNYPFIEQACQQTFSHCKTLDELISCLKPLKTTFRKLSSCGKEIFLQKIISRLRTYSKSEFETENTINSLTSLLKLLSLIKSREELGLDLLNDPLIDPWEAPSSILPMNQFYVDINSPHEFETILTIVSKRLKTNEQFIQCLRSCSSYHFQSEFIKIVGPSLFETFTRVDQLIDLFPHFTAEDGKLTKSALENIYCLENTIKRLNLDYTSYQRWKDFSSKYHKPHYDLLMHLINAKFERAIRIYSKLHAAFPEIHAVEPSALSRLIENNQVKDFYELISEQPLLTESWKLTSNPYKHSRIPIANTIAKLKSKYYPATHRGLAFVYGVRRKDQNTSLSSITPRAV